MAQVPPGIPGATFAVCAPLRGPNLRASRGHHGGAPSYRGFMVNSVFVVDACRTPIGKIKGELAEVRPDHLAADVIAALIQRNPWLDVTAIEDVSWGAANQAGEDNRNVARMAVLLPGLPVEIPGATVNRLCGSGMETVSHAARGLAAGGNRHAVRGRHS